MKTTGQKIGNQTLTSYEEMIHDATKASFGILDILEDIMRNEVFHSTLDWQTKKQFYAGAKEAYKIYRSNVAFYTVEKRVRQNSSATFAAEIAFEKNFAGMPDSPEKQAAINHLQALRHDEEQWIAILKIL
jgi:hypothetical protein